MKRALVEPSPSIKGEAERRIPRMMALCSLVLMGVFAVFDTLALLRVPDYQPPWAGYLVIGLVYALSRTVHYRLGGLILACMFPVVVVGIMAFGDAPEPVATLSFMMVSPLVAALFLAPRMVPIMGGVNLLGIAAISQLQNSPDPMTLVGSGVANGITTALALLYVYSRDQIEADRQRALRAEEERLRFAMSSAGLGWWQADLNSGSVSISEPIATAYGIPLAEWGGKFDALFTRVHPDDLALVEHQVASLRVGEQEAFTLQHRIIRPDGSIRWLEVHGRIRESDPSTIIGTVADITSRRELERQLVQAQKMEAIGRLAGGVAHDFNNLLTVVLGNVDLLRQRTRCTEVDEIERAATSAQALTSQLLAFSHQSDLTLEVLDLREVMRNAVSMAERIIGENIEVKFQCPEQLGWIRGDAVQIQQALLNLATNARDAMPGGGSLTFSLHDDPAPRGDDPALSSDDTVVVTVTDTGSGIAEPTRAQLFEPFFTTKPRGKGTGLGLSMVRSMMDRLGGSVEVASTVGSGATFTLRFPRVEARQTARTQHRPKSRNRGGGLILLVEDDASVRRLCERLLVEAGYEVLTASTTEQALAHWRDHHKRVTLLLSDVVMPGTPGPVLAKRLLQDRVDLPILFMSGYSPDLDVTLDSANMEFIPKPFAPSELLERIRTHIEHTARPNPPSPAPILEHPA